jgi:hypothetical protein
MTTEEPYAVYFRRILRLLERRSQPSVDRALPSTTRETSIPSLLVTYMTGSVVKHGLALAEKLSGSAQGD